MSTVQTLPQHALLPASRNLVMYMLGFLLTYYTGSREPTVKVKKGKGKGMIIYV